MEQVEQRRSEWEEEWGCGMGGEERTHSGFIEELDRFLVTEAEDSAFTGDKLSVGSAGDQKIQSQQNGEVKASSEENGEDEFRDGVEVDEQTEKEEMQRELDVCLWPIEKSGVHVQISLEEVERYYRFSRCCHWLCGMCLSFNLLTKYFCMHH